MENNNDKKEPLGIAEVLPADAAGTLVRAGKKAKQMPINSLARQKVIRDAIEKVKTQYPFAFRNSDRQR